MADAWWSGDIAELLAGEPETIVQRLATRLVETHYLNRDTQLHAWRQKVDATAIATLLKNPLSLRRSRHCIGSAVFLRRKASAVRSAPMSS